MCRMGRLAGSALVPLRSRRDCFYCGTACGRDAGCTDRSWFGRGNGARREVAPAQDISDSDLEIGGDLTGFPAGTTRFLTRDDLLALPQVSYTVTDDTNFTGPTKVNGVLLEDLLRDLSAVCWDSALVVAICDDQYRASYPRSLPRAPPSCSRARSERQAALRMAQGLRRPRLGHGTLHDFAREIHTRLPDFVPSPDESRKFRGESCGWNFATNGRSWARLCRAGRAQARPLFRRDSRSHSRTAFVATTRAPQAGKSQE